MLFIPLSRTELRDFKKLGIGSSRFNILFTKDIIEAEHDAYRRCIMYDDNKGIMAILRISDQMVPLQSFGTWKNDRHFLWHGYLYYDQLWHTIFIKNMKYSFWDVPTIRRMTDQYNRITAYSDWLNGFANMCTFMSDNPNKEYAINRTYTYFHEMGQQFAIEKYGKLPDLESSWKALDPELYGSEIENLYR